MSTTSPNGSSTGLIHEGWDHLKSQRPLAAWGSWQRALRFAPDSVAARQALAALESASDCRWLPGRRIDFRSPPNPRSEQSGMTACEARAIKTSHATADLFGQLATADPADSAAWYNRGLCLAWIGKNLEAIGCLDRVVGLEAGRGVRPGRRRLDAGRSAAPGGRSRDAGR